MNPIWNKSPNTGQWDLEGISGQQFEAHILRAMQKILGGHIGEVEILRTPVSGDRGRDIIIRSTRELELFGVTLHTKGKNSMNILIECKTTSKRSLPFDRFSSNILSNLDSAADYFILATNSSTTPRFFHMAQTHFSNKGTDFILADEFILYSFLDQIGLPIGKRPKTPNYSDLFVQHQVIERPSAHALALHVIILIRNFSNIIQSCCLNLKTDIEWGIKKPIEGLRILPLLSDSRHLILNPQPGQKSGNPVLILSADRTSYNIRIPFAEKENDFELPLTGKHHNNIINDALSKLRNNSSLFLFLLRGPGGTGKSRIIEEIIKRSGGTISFIRLRIVEEIFQGGDAALPQSYGDHILPISLDIEKFAEQLMEGLETSEEYRVVILDDLHQAPPEFCRNLKYILKNKYSGIAPAAIFFVGRDARENLNDEYTALISAIEHQGNNNSNLTSYSLNSLSKNESLILIGSAITNVSMEIQKSIYDITQGIPFEIRQIIDIMLEKKIAVISSKRAVNVTDPFKLHATLRTLTGIESIIASRTEELGNTDKGKLCLAGLSAAAQIGPMLRTDILSTFLPTESIDDCLKVLQRRHILIGKGPESIAFTHEFIHTHFRNCIFDNRFQQTIAHLFQNHSHLMSLLSPERRALIQHFQGNNRAAIANLKSILSQVKGIDNISQINLKKSLSWELDLLFRVCMSLDYSSEDLANILIGRAYLSAHEGHLQNMNQVLYNVAYNLNNLQLDRNLNKLFNLRLKQLRAHALLNYGKLADSEQLLLELDAEHKLDKSLECFHDLWFDLYERLEALYNKYNNLTLAESYLKLNKVESYASNNPLLIAIHMIAKAHLYHFNNMHYARNLYQNASEYSRENNHKSGSLHSDISIACIDTTLNNNNQGSIKQIIDITHTLLETSIEGAYINSIIRCYLLLANQYFILHKLGGGNMSSVHKHLERGEAISGLYGRADFTWQFANLRAIIALSNGTSKERIDEQFLNVVNELDRQGLLVFKGTDFCYPNIIVVSNYLRYLLLYGSTSELMNFLTRLRFPGSYMSSNVTSYKDNAAIRDIKKGGILFNNTRPNSVVADSETGLLLSYF